MIEDLLFELEDKMETSVEALKNRFKTLRTGKASKALVENIRAEYYGTPTGISQMANIATPEPRQIMIKPFDASCLGDIEKAILKSDLGVTPANDGKVIRLNFPPLTEERRKQVQSLAKEESERARVATRNARRDANKKLDVEQKSATISEDESYTAKEKVQELTSKFETLITNLLDAKVKEIMTV